MTRGRPHTPAELRRQAEARLQAAGDRAGAPTDLAGTLRLVHELQVHQVELELQNEELLDTRQALEVALARYTDLYDLAPVGYLTLDPDGRVEELNLAAAAMLGEERAALVGRDLVGHLHEASREGFRTFLAAALASGATVRRDVTLRGAAGAALPVHLEGLATALPGEPRERCRIAMVDVSELRRLEARALEAQKLEAIALLAAGVAHEINNPLAYLLEGMHSLQRALESGAPDLASLREIATDGCDGLERIREVVKSLGAFSKPQAAVRTVVEVGAELAAALRLASNELRHRARVVTRLDPVPAVLARPRELGQVFLNLLINAAHACPEGRADGATITVTSATDAAGWAVVEVADTGCGMAPEVVARIFEPYFTTKPQGIGTGLGLALVHGVVTAAGGRIEVTSRVGEGSAFRVLLPPAAGTTAGPEGRPGEAGPSSRPAQAEGAAGQPKARVLVIDDEPQVARSIARSLASRFDVSVSGSGTEALERLERGEDFDAVVCDLMMPGLSGQALHERVAARWPELAGRFVFLTGGAFGGEAQAFLAATRSAVVLKPFESWELRAAVELAAAPRSTTG